MTNAHADAKRPGAAAQSTVSSSLPCVSCGYDLNGLKVDGRCPECGEAIERSVGGDPLEYANAKWLNTITRGVVLLRIGAAGVVITPLLLMVISISLLTIVGGGMGRTADLLLGVVMSILWLGGLGAVTLGVFLATAQEPRDREREPMESRRNVARFAMVIATGALPATAMLYQAMFASGAARWIGYVVSMLLAVTLGVGVPATMDHLAKLARRCGDRVGEAATPSAPSLAETGWRGRRKARIARTRRAPLPEQLHRSGTRIAVYVGLAFGGVLGGSLLDALLLPDTGWAMLLRAAAAVATLVGSLGLLIEVVRIVRQLGALVRDLRHAALRRRAQQELERGS